MKSVLTIATLSILGSAGTAAAQWAPETERQLTPQFNRCMAGPDAKQGVHPAMMQCNDEEYRRQDARLNQSYRAAIARLPAARKVALRDSQRAWIRHRDKLCALDEDGGQAAELNASGCTLDETIKRRMWLDRYR